MNLFDVRLIDGKPFLGICLGLQLLFTESEEFGIHQGLNILPGRDKEEFPLRPSSSEGLKIPHMGWNTISIRQPAPLLDGDCSQTATSILSIRIMLSLRILRSPVR